MSSAGHRPLFFSTVNYTACRENAEESIGFPVYTKGLGRKKPWFHNEARASVPESLNVKSFLFSALLMNLHAVQHFHKSGIVVVYDLAVTQIQFGDFRHILLAKFKIPDIHILLHTVLVYGFGDYHHASL